MASSVGVEERAASCGAQSISLPALCSPELSYAGAWLWEKRLAWVPFQCPRGPALPCGTSGGSLQLSAAEISIITAAQHVLRVDGVPAHSRNSAPGRACVVSLLPGCCLVAKLCLTLCSLMDCSLPGSSIHGICQTKILEWVAISLCRGSSQPRDRTRISCVSCIGRQLLYH